MRWKNNHLDRVCYREDGQRAPNQEELGKEREVENFSHDCRGRGLVVLDNMRYFSHIWAGVSLAAKTVGPRIAP